MGRIFIAIMLLISVDAWLQENDAELVVSCDDSAMTVQMTFDHPFSGIVFVPEHYYDPTCSFGVPPNSSTSQITFTLRHDSCKMQIKNAARKLVGYNSLVVFHHRMLETIYDYNKNVSCELQQPIDNLNTNVWLEPVLKTWITFENPLSVLPEHIVDKMGLDGGLLLVYHVKDKGLHRDMVVMNCIGHDTRTVNRRTSFYQISNPLGCASESDLVSNFTVLRNPPSNPKMMAFTEIKNFSMVIRKRLYITCGAEICKNKCEHKCGEISQRGVYFSDIVTKGLVNRLDGSTRPASLTAFERFDRQKRSHSDIDLFLQNATDEQYQLFLQKIVLPYSVTEANKLFQNITTVSQISDGLIRSKRSIMQKTKLIPSGLNVIVIKSNKMVELKHSVTKEQSRFNSDTENYTSENFSDFYEIDSVVKVKMSLEPNHSSGIDENHKSNKFNFSSILRALVAILALICISSACYSLFSFKSMRDTEVVSHYASQSYI